MVQGSIYGSIYGSVHSSVHGLVHVAWTWLTLRSTWSFNLNHVHQSIALRLIECACHNVLLEYSELPCVLPYAVHLDLGYCPDTQGYLGLLSGPHTPSHTL